MVRLLAVSLLAAAACAPEGAERFLVYDLDPATRTYALRPAVITTLAEPHEGRGVVARLRAGGELVASLGSAESEQEIRDGLHIDGGATPDIQFTVRGGVAVPWDFDSALMLSLYHHLERASEFFAVAGVPLARVRRLDAYYYATLDIPFVPTPVPLISDNAAYVMTLDVFFVPPRQALDDVPLVTNRGVVVHEYSHAVLNRLLFDDDRVPDYLHEEWPKEAVNEVRSLDEGIADTFAAIATGDPDFIAPSIDAELYEIDRDLTVERHYTDALRGDVLRSELIDYDPYALGSVIASTLWAMRELVGEAVLARTLVSVLDALPVPDASFRLADVWSALVAAIDPPQRSAVCALVLSRMDAIAGDITCSP
jgi:hypothetical protein